MKFNAYTKLALKVATAGGKVLMNYFDRPLKVDFKGVINPVTDADRNSQETIRRIIAKTYPSHTMLGEEDENPVACSDYCWIVDPLDGTVNFIHNMPLFCVSVALAHKGKIISGVVHAPYLKETFVAEKGKGAWLNGKRISVSRTKSLVKSLAITGFPYSIHSDIRDIAVNFSRVLTNVQGVRRLGSAAIDLAYVAMGRCEAFWEEELNPWDVAAGSLLVTEAGGKVTDFEMGSDYLYGNQILASNGSIHNQIRKLITKQAYSIKARIARETSETKPRFERGGKK